MAINKSAVRARQGQKKNKANTKPVTAPGQQPVPNSSTEKLWHLVLRDPGGTHATLAPAAIAAGIKKNSVSPLLTQLTARGALRCEGENRKKRYWVASPTHLGKLNKKAAPAAAPSVAPAAPVVLPPAAGTAAADALLGNSNMERIWNAGKHAPARGLTAREIADYLEPLGVPRSCVSTNIKQLCHRGLMQECGKLPAEPGRTRTPWLYRSVGDTYPRSPVRATPTAATATASLPASPPASPLPPSSPAAATAETAGAAPSLAAKYSRRGRHVVHWTQEEIEALCRKWAHDHVHLATSLSDKGLLKIARMEGFGYRPRDAQPESRRTFITKHLPLVEQFIQEERAAKLAPPPAAAAAPTPADAIPQPQPAAAEPEPTFGALIDRALQRTVKQAVKEAVGQAEDRMIAAFTEMLKGIPGYNRPLIIKHETVTAPEPSKPKYQVVIVNALSAQFESVKRAYPDLDLRLVSHRMPGEEDPDLVVCLVKFSDHAITRALRKKYGSRYCPVNGAADSVKLAIRDRLQLPMAH